MGECWQQKHTQHAPSTKMECDYLNGWIKKRSHTQKSHPKVVNPRDIAGERQKKKKKKKKIPVKSATEWAHKSLLSPEQWLLINGSQGHSNRYIKLKSKVVSLIMPSRKKISMPANAKVVYFFLVGEGAVFVSFCFLFLCNHICWVLSHKH